MKGAQVLVGVMRKEELGALLESLKKSKLDPRIVTHPGLTYQNVLATLPASDDQGVAVVDIGHERTSMAIGRAGGPVDFARTFMGGGLAPTKALSNEFKIGIPEAQSWKETHGAVGTEVGAPTPSVPPAPSCAPCSLSFVSCARAASRPTPRR